MHRLYKGRGVGGMYRVTVKFKVHLKAWTNPGSVKARATHAMLVTYCKDKVRRS